MSSPEYERSPQPLRAPPDEISEGNFGGKIVDGGSLLRLFFEGYTRGNPELRKVFPDFILNTLTDLRLCPHIQNIEISRGVALGVLCTTTDPHYWEYAEVAREQARELIKASVLDEEVHKFLARLASHSDLPPDFDSLKEIEDAEERLLRMSQLPSHPDVDLLYQAQEGEDVMKVAAYLRKIYKVDQSEIQKVEYVGPTGTKVIRDVFKLYAKGLFEVWVSVGRVPLPRKIYTLVMGLLSIRNETVPPIGH